MLGWSVRRLAALERRSCFGRRRGRTRLPSRSPSSARGSSAGESRSEPADPTRHPGGELDRPRSPEAGRPRPTPWSRTRPADDRHHPSTASRRRQLARPGTRRNHSPADRGRVRREMALHQERHPTPRRPRWLAHRSRDGDRRGSRGHLRPDSNAGADPRSTPGCPNGTHPPSLRRSTRGRSAYSPAGRPADLALRKSCHAWSEIFSPLAFWCWRRASAAQKATTKGTAISQ